MRPSHRVSLPTLSACCCWTSQNPHPNISRSASLSVGGWHQALASGASDSTNTLTFGPNPYHEPPPPGREALRLGWPKSLQAARLCFLISALFQLQSQERIVFAIINSIISIISFHTYSSNLTKSWFWCRLYWCYIYFFSTVIRNY